MQVIDQSGKLLAGFLPASYCDSSFLIDYLLFPLELIYGSGGLYCHDSLLRNYFSQKESRREKLKPIVEKIHYNETQTRLVYTPLVTLECTERLIELNFKAYVREEIDVETLQKMGRKPLGGIIQKVYSDFKKAEEQGHENPNEIQKLGYNVFDTHFDHIDEGPMLDYFVQADVGNLALENNSSTFRLFYQLARVQIGLADLMHLNLAKHLGCENFITFDQDFVRIKDEVKEQLNINIVSDLRQIEKII